jgi:hypothetical protein
MDDASDRVSPLSSEVSIGSQSDDESVLDGMIKDCGGDVRAAALALLRINRTLLRLRRRVSRGFVRGRWD